MNCVIECSNEFRVPSDNWSVIAMLKQIQIQFVKKCVLFCFFKHIIPVYNMIAAEYTIASHQNK